MRHFNSHALRIWKLAIGLAAQGCVITAAGCGTDGRYDVPHDAAAGQPEASVGDAGPRTAAAPKEAATPCVPDQSAPVPNDRCTTNPDDKSTPQCEAWMKVEPMGAECSNGSQYKFFVNYSKKSNNLVVMLEPGGACWDYGSCTGTNGARGAANRKGIPDDHMATAQYINLLRRSDANPAQDWNLVYVPYCTGDVHAGNKVATYENPAGGPALTYRHVGHHNVMTVLAWLKMKFPTIPKLLITGCSAGGIGALQSYAFLREGLPGAQCGYLLDDSGPAFHSDGPSHALHAKIRSAWNLDSTLDELQGVLPVDVQQIKQDFGLINLALADKYPHDRLTLSAYRMDFNYSLYSYETFFPGSSEAKVHELWGQDLDKLLATFDMRPNLAYYVPYFRHDNCSHCVSIPPIDHEVSVILDQPWLGSEIAEQHLNLRDFTQQLLDDTRPLKSYREGERADAAFTPEESAMCIMPKPAED